MTSHNLQLVGNPPSIDGFGDFFRSGGMDALIGTAKRPSDFGSQAASVERLTPQEAKQLGIVRCPGCGSRVYVDLDDTRQSPRKRKNLLSDNPRARQRRERRRALKVQEYERSAAILRGQGMCVKCITDRLTVGGRQPLPEAPECFD